MSAGTLHRNQTSFQMNRQPAGSGRGGQFATTHRSEAGLDAIDLGLTSTTSASCKLCLACQEARTQHRDLLSSANYDIACQGESACVLTPSACGCSNCR